jgi:hypothetical protein
MSHIVTIHPRVTDPDAVAAACRRLNLAAPVQGTARIYRTSATGLIVQLPDWQFPIVLDTTSGVIHYDNFSGCWGEQRHLDRFLQAYAVERCRQEARKKGHQVSEQQMQDGSVKLQIVEGARA